jgi:hypothetical protein
VKNMLKLAKDLVLPLEAVTQTIALCGYRTRMPAIVAAVAAIVGLFLRRCPVAIVWRVWAVIIAAVNRVPVRWARAHVGEEVLEAVAPAIAYRDTASAIFRVVGRSRIQASILQALPSMVFDSRAQAVRTVGFVNALEAQAAAGGAPFPKMVLADDNQRAAIAAAGPGTMSASTTIGLMQDCEASESLSVQIRRALHIFSLYGNGAFVDGVSR